MRFGTFSYNQARPTVPERQLFEELLDQIELSDRLGFHEAWFAEHHHSDYGLIASPNLLIASLASRTQRLRLGNLVNVLPLHDPMRLAEECAILDILTGGRLDVGVGRGVPRDDVKHGLDPQTAQARYVEGVDIMLKAWTEDTFSYEGAAWSYSDISCRPRPLQRPHPPVYYGASSPESPAMIARRGWNMALLRQPLENVVQAIGSLRAERAALGEPPTGGSALVIRTVYVADSDEQAWAEVGPSLARFWQLASDNRWSPEPVTLDDLPRFTARYPQFQGGLTRESVVNLGLAFIGSPQTVAKQAAAFVHAAGPDSLVGMFGFGELNHDQVVRSMQLFSGAVMPALVDL